MTDSERLNEKLRRNYQDPLSDTEWMNGLLDRCGCDYRVAPGTPVLPQPFFLIIEHLLDRLDKVEGELDVIKSCTPTVT